jgi:16S rRNA (guanine966-N2)-methyltransferase
MSLRIVGGDLRGRRLPAPSPGVRPTAARVREALFSIWAQQISGCAFLDLFAGSGVMALEALSRGARSATLVEGSARVAGALVHTSRTLVGTRARVLRGQLPKILNTTRSTPFELVFADPPYEFVDHGALLEALPPWLTAGAEVAIEHSVRTETPVAIGSLRRFDLRAWGESGVSRYRLETDSSSVE